VVGIDDWAFRRHQSYGTTARPLWDRRASVPKPHERGD
jgi:hypothetical protein